MRKGYRRLIMQHKGISGIKCFAIDSDVATRYVNICHTIIDQSVRGGFRAIEQAREESGVCVDRHRPLGTIRRGDEPQFAAFFSGVEGGLLVFGFQILLVGQDPDLK